MSNRWADVDDVLPVLYSPDRIGRLLLPIAYGGIAALVLVVAMAWPVATPLERSALIVEALALMAAVLPIKRGWLRSAAWLMVLALVVGSITVVLSFGSMRTVGSFGFVFALIIAAVFLPRRDIAFAVLLVWLVIAALTAREVHDGVPGPMRPFGWPHAAMLGVGLLFVTFVVGYARNVSVTAVRRQYAELDERMRAEERLRLSMEATRQGWFDLDLVTGKVESSIQFQRLMGAADGGDERTLTREAWITAIHHDDRPAVLQRFERCLRTGETEQMEYRLMGLDGSFRWIRSIAKVVQRDDSGRPIRMTGTHADVTDQRAVTQALEASERSYRALVEMSPVGVLVLRDGIIRYANPAALLLLGVSQLESIIGVPMQHFVPEDASAELATICRLASNREGIATDPIEQPMVRHDGERFEASIRCTRVVYEGSPTLQLSFADISAQKQAEEARLRSRQLEALGTLAGGIAHDFNNILLAIRGNAELVADEPSLSANGAEQLQEILIAGQRASELVRRITAFARPKEPRQELVHLADLLDEVLRLLRPTVPSGVSLDVHVAADVAPILADAAQVHETIVNLTTNAVYAIGNSRVGRVVYSIDSIELRGEAARSAGVQEGQYTRLTVQDTGVGMPADIQRRVFDAFYTTKPVGEGSGLGLSMAYGTMRSHGGAISVESLPGHGATFRLLFPAAAHSLPAAESTRSENPAEVPALRVMFVDDEPQLIRLAERTLTRLGHRVTAFNDPVAALQSFRSSPGEFDVVVTDLSMPRMSGLDLARALRETPSDIPIVMVTGYADDADEAHARDAGVTRLAVKAADAHQLSRLLAEIAPNA